MYINIINLGPAAAGVVPLALGKPKPPSRLNNPYPVWTGFLAVQLNKFLPFEKVNVNH